MSITIIETKEIDDFYDLRDICWSGAIQRLDEIEELGLEDEFMDYLLENFMDAEYTTTDLNDFIWFECDDWIEEHTTKEDEDEN